ncbi:MAG: glycosyl hydrolase [Streptococcaceae bacterium]|jgi:alpha-glucosidase (family GH31 glycosyl hydrolase)|nr:glycosyl hydrolase [Streptococcaceae bacterium]
MNTSEQVLANLLKALIAMRNEDDIKVKEVLSKLDLSNMSLPQKSFYVWLYSQVQDGLSEQVNSIVNEIENDWSSLSGNLFDSDVDIYTSNLSIYYSALSLVKNNYGLFDVQRTMTDIRDYIFNNMIKAGSLVGASNRKVVAVDELLGVLPFGLFAPEDLIVVSAKVELEEQVLSDAISLAIMGIYFTEKFELENANFYLQKSKKIAANELELLFVSLLEQYMSEKLGSSKVEFIHKPFGNGNVYEALPYERRPHYPCVGESCSIRMQLLGSSEEPILVIGEDSINGKLVDEAQNIFEFTFVVDKSLSQSKYYFRVGEEYQSAEYILEIENTEYSNAISFIGSDAAVNYYEVCFTSRKVFLQLGQEQFKLALKQPQMNLLHYEVSSSSFLNLESFAFQCGNQTILLDKEEPFSFAEIVGKGVISFEINYQDDEKAAYLGFGERYNTLNQKGNAIDCFVYNQYRDQGTKTYLPMPYFITNKNYGIYIDTAGYTKFDLQHNLAGRVSIQIDFEINQPEFAVHFLVGSPKQMITQYLTLAGKPNMVPTWALGPWMSSNNWDRDSIVRAEIDKTNHLDIPSTVIVLEQWSDEATYYMWNDAKYELKNPAEGYTNEEIEYPKWGRWPNPCSLIKHCHTNGLKFILWQVPIEKYLNQQKHPLKDSDEKFMIENGYAVMQQNGEVYRIPENWYTDSLLLDFTNDEARKWWFAKRQYLIEMGVDGFKTDGGEMVFGNDAVFSDGSTGRTMRNKYPNDYISSYYQFAQQNAGMTFSRSGYLGCQQFPAHWAGDERSTFEAFQRSLKAGINAGMSGVIFWGWDLGGFNGDIPTAELFIRSAQMAAFCPIMQYHAESKGEFNQDRTPWNISDRTGDERAISIYRKFANVRMNLMPYIYDQSIRCVEDLKPLMRSLFIEYPEQEEYIDSYDQYMFGDSLLVAPVIHEGKTSREIMLPEGEWVSFWDKRIIKGGQTIKFDAALDEIPVFVKENSAILLNLGDDKELGSTIGNQYEKYNNLTLLVCAKTGFKTTINTYFGFELIVKVNDNLEVVVTNKAFSVPEIPIRVELIKI